MILIHYVPLVVFVAAFVVVYFKGYRSFMRTLRVAAGLSLIDIAWRFRHYIFR